MSDFSKARNYLKRNGIKNTYYAVKERLKEKGVPYSYAEIPGEEKERQKKASENFTVSFSILVPVYETPEPYLREMIVSCLDQTYGNFELILADASVTDVPSKIISDYTDKRIIYIKLKENRGISGNTNAALKKASKEYCALLDHDDILTPDALYEMADVIEKGKRKGLAPSFLYSDEDKCNSDRTLYFDPHFKEKFNLDLLLSNNYICHFTVMKTELMKKLGFRSEYNGSQDHDLFLRAAGELIYEENRMIPEKENSIEHVAKVLYHWRCHENSTSANPESKNYAYVAGRQAIEDFTACHYVKRQVLETAHKGFYMVDWGDRIFEIRPEVGAIGGPLIRKNKITRGILNKDGTTEFEGLDPHFSGYMHRAVLIQQAYALDIRTITPSPYVKDIYDECIHKAEGASEEDIRSISLSFAEQLYKKGLIILYYPSQSRAKLRKY